MADGDTANVCAQIIHSHFGQFTSIVVSTLLSRGRLPFPQLVRYSNLKPRTVRAAILVLIQHNILWHATSEDGGEVFEVNTNECLARLRFGRYVWLAEQCFGTLGASIVQLILDHGKLRPRDIMSRMAPQGSKESTACAQALHGLVTSSYLKPSTILSHISPQDKRILYETEEKAKIAGFPTAKELRQAREVAIDRLKREEEEAENVGLVRRPPRLSVPLQLTRKIAEIQGPLSDENAVDDDVYFRVNYAKFNTHIRNKLIEAAARERFNDGAASVLKATLKATESKQKTITDIRSDPTTAANISMQLEHDHALASGLVLNTRKPKNIVLVKAYLNMLAFVDNPTPTGRASSFVSLNGSKVYLRDCEGACWKPVTRERHGDEGVRILRLLIDSGKVDEKQISKLTMIAPKDVRPLLSAMSAESLISIQEVPKSADRNPTRMFFLWYVDLPKACSVLLGNLYKTVYNINVRKQAETEERGIKAVSEKRERSDVSQNEGLLTRNERETLREWESRIEKLTVLEARVEEVVFILNDFGACQNEPT
ncbi:hypothetical protein EDB85DRAFT_2074259 [Lactarius pseudohatsudake]|nr:hypothetical protein EDB85DRAFT_2074259 [Lactarius pseudohatsudake]